MFKYTFAFLLFCFIGASAFAQEIQFTSVPAGYQAGSIGLPEGFAGALCADPTDDTILYASIGNFGHNSLARIDLTTKGVDLVAEDKFGALAGIAVISPTKIICIDNYGATAGDPNDTILLASDNNADGDFNDAGEITELIDPILADSDFGFTGAQARIAPAGNACHIPAGALLVQTADGSSPNGAELLVIDDPLGTPAYRPAGAALFTGFAFNGGFAFDSTGRLILGEQTSFAGTVHALVDADASGMIGAGESNALAGGESFLADLVVDAEDDVLFCAANASFLGAIRTFRLPADPLSETAVAEDFAVTDSAYLTGVMLNSTTRHFEPNQSHGAMLVTSGWVADFSASAVNLLTLTPLPYSGVEDWREF